MDNYSDPKARSFENINLDDVRATVRKLEDEHRAKGVKLSGRVIHICHYLPLTCSIQGVPGIASPPPTPPIQPADVERPAPAAPEKWKLGTRYGHSAMTSGVRSLSATHEQVIVGWTGDIYVNHDGDAVHTDAVSEEDRASLEEAIATYRPQESDPDDHLPMTHVPVWLDDKVAHGHYEGYCKTILWPLFHYLLWQDVARESASVDDHWEAYVAANATYAQRVHDIYQPGDLIWVHDYHLLLVPRMLRHMLPDAVTGLFVHTPFPSSEVFRCLPRRKEILDGMLGANLVCFQTYSYGRHFISSCIRVCGYETTGRGIDNQGHVTAVSHCPVGVDTDRIARDLQRPGIQPKLDALRTLYEGKKIIVGRDKLDVVKGVIQKLRAFEKLLREYPEWIGKVALIQVTSPALTDSPKLERQVSELVAHINGEFGSLDFIPVHHYHQTIKKDEFYALLSVADLAVISALRDGMNTTAMEYVIAQRKTKKSPIVLSEFMGITSIMSQSIQINPWNIDDLAAAINEGLLMSEEEKTKRSDKLYEIATTHTSHTWAAVLVQLLLSQIGYENTAHQTPFLAQHKLAAAYTKAKRRLFLFDYDGTLTPIVKTPSMAVPPDGTLEALEKLSSDPQNLVYIISGRDSPFLEQHLGHLKNIGMSAEHGGFMRAPGDAKWTNLTEALDMSWMSEVEEIFRYYTERTTGSHIEIKKSSITWHYRSADPDWGLFQCRQCQDLLENNLAHKRPIEVLVGKKNLEVRPLAINKGEIVKRIMYNNPDAEFVFCAGDDKTDEDMFRAIAPFSAATSSSILQPPTGIEVSGTEKPGPVELALRPEGVFSTAVGTSSKKTLALWHVTTPFEVIQSMLDLVNGVQHPEIAEPAADVPVEGEAKL